MTTPPTEAAALRRMTRLVYQVGMLCFPVFAFTDWMLTPEAIAHTVLVRAAWVLFAVGALVLIPRVSDRGMMALLYAGCLTIGAASGAVMYLNQDLSATVDLGVIPLIIAMFVPLGGRHAFFLHGGLWAVMFLAPIAAQWRTYPHPSVTIAGFIAGVSVAAIAVVNHTMTSRGRRRQEEALAELDQRTRELTSWLAEERARAGMLSGALGEVARVLAAIDSAAGALEAEADGLSATARQVDSVAREAVESGAAMSASAGAMEQALGEGRQRVEEHSRWEAEHGAPAREALIRGAIEVAEAVVEIGDTARHVTEIAKETRLLALNTGVAAARESGASGLYVVSTGMRELSDRVEAEAARMRQLVVDVVRAARRLDDGVSEHAALAGAAEQASRDVLFGLREVGESIERIRASVAALAGASSQQSSTAHTLSDSAQALAASAAGLRAAASELRSNAERVWLDSRPA